MSENNFFQGEIFTNSEDLKKIKIDEAGSLKAEEKENDKVETFFSSSGLKIFNDVINAFIKESYKAVFFEFLSIASTLKEGKLSDFCLLKTREPDYHKSFDDCFYKIVDNLHKNDKTVLYHPHFFIAPTQANYYISLIKGSDGQEKNKPNNNSRDKYRTLDLKELKLDNNEIVYIQNSTFEIKYAEFLEGREKYNDKTLEDVFVGMHEIMHNTYVTSNDNSTLIGIPIIGPPNQLNSNFEGLGCCFVFIIGLDNVDKIDFKRFCKKIEKEYKSITYNYLLKTGLYLAQEARKQSIKSTVAAIMSRNMSHNLGSHVLSNLKGELDDIGKVFKDNHDSDTNIPFKSENLFGLKWFVNYLQERQDFIATIGGFENQTFMPVNFKTFVFDGLLPDHQFQRHADSTSLHAHKNYLLEYIIKSENIYRNQIVIKYRSFESSAHNPSTEIDYKKLTQLNVCFPGGIVGRQAFFSIFENIIRNAAKHNEVNDNLEIIIDTPDDNNYNTNEYIKFTITDNLNSIAGAKEKIDKAIIEPIFDESQEKQGNKGIKEMKISAAWLRGIRLEEIDGYKEVVDSGGKIIRPEIIEFAESNGSVQYAFYLLKPKELLIYINNEVKDELNLTKEELEQFNASGIDIITNDYFQDGNTYNLRHSLFVILEDNVQVDDENIHRFFNQRKHYIKVNELHEIIKTYKNEPITLIASFWNSYLGLSREPLPYIDIRPKNIEDEIKFDKFRVQLNSKGYSHRNDSDIKILFKHHNDTENTYNQFRNSNQNLFKHLQFLEGISGGNSTELIASRTEKTELFYYKLLQSCMTDVIIIDERLWNNNSKTDIKQLPQILDEDAPVFNQEVLERINNDYTNKEEWSDALLNALKIQINDETKETVRKEYRRRKNNYFTAHITAKLKVTVNSAGSINDCKKANEYKYWFFKKKNIEVLNIIFRNKKERLSFEFYNLYLDKVAEHFFNNNMKFSNCLNNNYPHKIITIHQGIIDKIQNMINEDERKHGLNNKDKKNAIEILNGALPFDCIKIIHSGRGKPSVESPKGFYFVPYASLESAFYDCKFSLTDLLFNAKAELL